MTDVPQPLGLSRDEELAALHRYLGDSPIPVALRLVHNDELVFANRRLLETYRLSETELFTRAPDWFFVDRDARTRILRLLQTSHEVNDHEVLMRRGDGTTFWAALSFSTTEFQGFKAHHSWLVDITARRASEQARTWLHSVVHNSPVPITLKDCERRMLMVNPAFELEYGIRAAEVINKPTEQHAYIVDADAVREHDEFVLQERTTSTRNREVITPGGERSIRTIIKFPVIDADGELLGIGTISVNETERYQLEQALMDHDALFHTFFENVPIILSLKDLAGRYVLANDTFCAWLGYEESDLLGLNARDVFDEATATVIAHADEQVIAGQTAVTREFEAVRKDGTVAHLFEAKFPVKDALGKLFAIGTASIDITQTKRTERNLRQAQRMDALGQLTGGIAHDFNNVLGIIQGNLDLLEINLPAQGNVQEKISATHKAAERAAVLTSKLLAFARQNIQAASPLDVNIVIRDSLVLFERSLTFGNALRTELAEDLWLTNIDPGDLEDALLNLVLNARDAITQGGQLSISTRNVAIDSNRALEHVDARPSDYVQITVTDTGCGIQSSILDRIFDPLFTTKEPGKGTGLGLAMVYGFVRRSNGFLSVDSVLNEGSSFHLFLPRSEQTAAPKTPDPDDLGAVPRGEERILVVDDEPGLLEVATLTLSRLGYTVFSANNARDALRLLEAHPDIDLLFSDVVMAGSMNGFQLAQDACTCHPDLKVILTSGFVQRPTQVGRYAQFFEKMLFKPYRLGDLARRIRATLDQSAGQAR